MARFRQPKDPLAYLSHLLPYGTMRYFTRRGIGCVIQCPFCPTKPPKELSGYQRWRWVTAHIALRHKEKNAEIYKVGSQHGLEKSQERKAA